MYYQFKISACRKLRGGWGLSACRKLKSNDMGGGGGGGGGGRATDP